MSTYILLLAFFFMPTTKKCFSIAFVTLLSFLLQIYFLYKGYVSINYRNLALERPKRSHNLKPSFVKLKKKKEIGLGLLKEKSDLFKITWFNNDSGDEKVCCSIPEPTFYINIISFYICNDCIILEFFHSGFQLHDFTEFS